MKIQLQVPEGIQIQAFYLIFLIHTTQVGTGIMGISTHIYAEAKQDAWISVIIAGVWVSISVFCMSKILNQYQSADLPGIQVDIFGKWIGKILGTLLALYFFSLLISVLLNYIEVVQVFLFPTIPTWLMCLFLLSLVVYAVLGGVRVIVGVSFLFFIGTFWLVIVLYKPVSLMEWNHFFPIMTTPYSDILQGTFKATYSLVGFETLMFIYPYIQNKQQAHRSVQIGVWSTTLLTLAVVAVTVGYFSGPQLERLIWPTLSMFKIIQFSFLERFDIIAVGIWMIVILPNMITVMWLCTYTFKRIYGLKQKHVLYVSAVLLFFGTILFQDRLQINYFTDKLATVGFYIAFVYPLVLLPIVLGKNYIRRKRGGSQ
ncbi:MULTISPECIES: GerAB/ArcD/ProY family transporter [Pontibacillus]|uniref:GerAB/ArcD/ProY family transporter n=1 Tax=Pontibacillus chungwhensis TaxID=265426 RepID=A0ABY8UZ67_9BACI|nr:MULTISPECIES: GerAB/ArcD/ProY family transporter [Pontibacillus]MCD5324838.1 spore germination protein [Pontibacillus sp. HN14]WIF98797.1 GerAB/ArcD/ProY family transporter [Pontibacillus chungwhensis]